MLVNTTTQSNRYDSLTRLTQLQCLCLHNWPIKKTTLQHFYSLQTLRLTGARGDTRKLARCASHLTSLTCLQTDFHRANACAVLNTLTRLSHLVLRTFCEDDKMTRETLCDYVPPASLRRFGVDLYGEYESDCLSVVGTWTTLQHLDLNISYRVDDNDGAPVPFLVLPPLAQLTALTHLTLKDQVQFVPSELQCLTALRRLDWTEPEVPSDNTVQLRTLLTLLPDDYLINRHSCPCQRQRDHGRCLPDCPRHSLNRLVACENKSDADWLK
jgi:hypothetical protein